MSFRITVLMALCIVAVWQLAHDWRLRPVHPVDGVTAPGEPLQLSLESESAVVHGRWRLYPRATYDITARILSREDYRFDRVADLVPEDLALGWGPMSDNRILSDFEISQDARFFSWRPRGPLPIPRQTVIEHSANTHVIPADTRVAAQLSRLRVGQVVHLRGLLVDGKRDDGAYIKTSLTRSDTGAGACEIMLVESVELTEPDARWQSTLVTASTGVARRSRD